MLLFRLTKMKNIWEICKFILTWGLLPLDLLFMVGDLIKKLWGDNYYNPKEKKWSHEAEDETAQRAFCSYILNPLTKLANDVSTGKKEVFQPLLKKLGIELKQKN